MKAWKEAHRSLIAWIDRLSIRITSSLRATMSQLRTDGGQTVAEYALVLLVVAAIAVAFLLWARSSGRLDAFFDAIFDKLLNSVDPDATPSP